MTTDHTHYRELPSEQIEEVCNRVAQEIVYCNCAEEGDWHRCDHHALAKRLAEHAWPAFTALLDKLPAPESQPEVSVAEILDTLKSRYTGKVSHTRREAWNEALNEVSLALASPSQPAPEAASAPIDRMKVCILCETEMQHATGIGYYCPSYSCKNLDGPFKEVIR